MNDLDKGLMKYKSSLSQLSQIWTLKHKISSILGVQENGRLQAEIARLLWQF